MNIHVNPFDDEIQSQINNHIYLLSCNNDPFVTYINQKEGKIYFILFQFHFILDQRKQNFYEKKYLNNLKQFQNQNYPKQGTLIEDIKKNHGDEENEADLSLLAKSSKTIDMNPKRFECILGKFACLQENIKRQYLKTLPYYAETNSENVSLET